MAMPIRQMHSPEQNFEWIDIFNPSEEELIGFGDKYGLTHHMLVDCLDTDHLPKYEEHNEVHFVITRILADYSPEAHTIREISNKIALFYTDRFVITVHRTDQPCVEDIRAKYLSSGRLRSPSEVVTKVIWHVLHSYDKPVLALSQEVEEFEDQLFLKSISSGMLERIYYLKRKAGLCLKLLLLTEEAINSVRTTPADNPALQDVRDLQVKLEHLYEQVQEDINNLLHIYMSLSSQKTNDVMKVLTIFSVFFMPLTFIVGIYGMNFQYMPELHQRWGYPASLALMATVSALIYVWFKRKDWL